MATSEGCDSLVGATLVGNPTLTDKLKRKREGLRAELEQIEAAEKILAANPEVRDLFDIVSKVRLL